MEQQQAPPSIFAGTGTRFISAPNVSHRKNDSGSGIFKLLPGPGFKAATGLTTKPPQIVAPALFIHPLKTSQPSFGGIKATQCDNPTGVVPEKITKKGFVNHCRTCCQEFDEGKLTDIYSLKGKNLKLRLKISRCLPITVKKNDLFPSKMCSRCIIRLEFAHEIFESCQLAMSFFIDKIHPSLPTPDTESYPVNQGAASFSLFTPSFSSKSRGQDELEPPRLTLGDTSKHSSEPYQDDEDVQMYEVEGNTLICDQCEVSPFANLHQYLRHNWEQHERLIRCCKKCKLMFDSLQGFNDHLEDVHVGPFTKKERKDTCGIATYFNQLYTTYWEKESELREARERKKVADLEAVLNQEAGTKHVSGKKKAELEAFSLGEDHAATVAVKKAVNRPANVVGKSAADIAVKNTAAIDVQSAADLAVKNAATFDVQSAADIFVKNAAIVGVQSAATVAVKRAADVTVKNAATVDIRSAAKVAVKSAAKIARKRAVVSKTRGRKSHTCDDCGLTFYHQKIFYHHGFIVHNHPKKCFICKVECRGQKAYQDHQKEHTRIRQLSCRYCDFVGSDRKAVTSHLMNNHLDKLPRYRCKECNKLFYDRGAFKTHKITHKKRQFLCTECGAILKSRSSFAGHLRSHLPKDQQRHIECDVCKKLIMSVLFESHMLKHVNHPFPCHLCSKQLTSQKMLECHIAWCHEGKKNIKCLACHTICANQKILDKHKNDHKNGLAFYCNLCEFRVFSSFEDLEDHCAAHPAEDLIKSQKQRALELFNARKSFACYECGKNFKTEEWYNFHKSTCRVEPEAPQDEEFVESRDIRELLTCGLCGESFLEVAKYIEHKSTHPESFVGQCKYCPRTFSTEKRRALHEKSHDQMVAKTYNYHCDLCNGSFKNRSQLFNHMVKVHLRKITRCMQWGLGDIQTCPVCTKTFPCKQSLWSHTSKYHKGEWPYSCDVCGVNVGSKPNLVEHKLTHSKTNDFKCSQCDYLCFSMPALKKHMESHSGVLHTCDVCGKSFSKLEYLQYHMKIHTGVRKFTCICGQSFLCTKEWRKHRKECLSGRSKVSRKQQAKTVAEEIVIPMHQKQKQEDGTSAVVEDISIPTVYTYGDQGVRISY